MRLDSTRVVVAAAALVISVLLLFPPFLITTTTAVPAADGSEGETLVRLSEAHRRHPASGLQGGQLEWLDHPRPYSEPQEALRLDGARMGLETGAVAMITVIPIAAFGCGSSGRSVPAGSLSEEVRQ